MSRPTTNIQSRPRATIVKYLGLVISILLLATGCARSPESPPQAAPPSATPDDESMFGAPKVGACRNLNAADMDRASVEKFVPCNGTYTSKVVDVVQLPPEVSPTPTNTQLVEVLYQDCAKPAREVIGGSLILRQTSLFHSLFYLPSAEQQKKGARWLACDVAAVDEEGLIPLPVTTPFLQKAESDTKSIKRFAQCIRLNDDNSDTLVGCDKKHILQPGFVLTFANEKAAKAVDPLKECKRGKSKDAAYILGGLEPRRSAFEEGGLPWIIPCMVWDAKAGKL